MSGRATAVTGYPEIEGYEIGAKLGSGGMGTVYAARQLSLDRPVAVKVLASDLSGDEAFRARFRREAKTHGSFRHPHVVSVHHFGEAGDDLYLVMDLIEGSDLSKILAAGDMPPERAVALLDQIASALDAAHRRGLVHRDVKPHNILVTPGDDAYLADFGLTRSAADVGHTRSGAVVGTMDYVAPEQIRGETPTGAADLYSLTAVLHRCLTGEKPYPRPSDVAVMYAHTNDLPPRPTSVRPELPAALDDVIAAGMAKDPAARPGTATELIALTRAALAGTAPTPLHVQEGGSPALRRRLATALLALAVLLAGAFAGYQRDGGPAAPERLERIASTRIALRSPTRWERIQPASALPGLRLRHAIAVRDGDLSLVAGTTAVGDPGLLSDTVRAELPAHVRPTDRVRLIAAQALRYSSLTLAGKSAMLLAIPTAADVVYVVCSRPSSLTTADRSACNTISRSVQLIGRPAVPLAPTTAYATSLQHLLDDFARSRSLTLARLAEVNAQAAQADALANFEKPCRVAVSDARAIISGAQLLALHARITAVLASTCSAFADMAQAADDGARDRYNAARHRTQTLKRTLEHAVAALKGAGYDV